MGSNMKAGKLPQRDDENAVGTDFQVTFDIGGRIDMRNHILSTQPPDFKIVYHDGSSGKPSEIAVHTIVLRKYPVFDAMLSADLKENNEKQLVISGCSRGVIEKFIEFLYNDRVDGIDDKVDELLALAHKYMVLPLKEICGKAIEPKLAQNIISVFDKAVKYDVKTLKFQCHTQLPKQIGTLSVEQLCHILEKGQDLHVLANACEKQLIRMLSADNVFDLFSWAYSKSCVALYNEAALHIGKNWSVLCESHRGKVNDLTSEQLRVVVGYLSFPLAAMFGPIPRTCNTCKETYQPGAICGCGKVKCMGSVHEAHGGECVGVYATNRNVDISTNNTVAATNRCHCCARYVGGKFSLVE